jgi:hypothetical protein
MRESNEQSIVDIFREMLKRYRIDGKYRQAEVVQAWNEITDITINKHVSDIRLRGKVLVVKFDSAVLKHEYSFAKSKLTELINQKVGYDAIETLEFL